jgi:hypothetical protein
MSQKENWNLIELDFAQIMLQPMNTNKTAIHHHVLA